MIAEKGGKFNKRPGEQELDRIHNADIENLTEQKLGEIIGSMSWSTNPLNEIHLYELLKEK